MCVPRGYSTTQLLSKGSSGPSELTSMACTSPLIHHFQMATSQTGSTADVNACRDNELVDVESKNEERFTFSQIH